METIKASDALLKKLIYTPENALEYLDLVYVTDDILNISRSSDNNKFNYIKNGKLLTRKKTLQRISKLVIPPAWKNVKISSLENGHLQAIGRDNKFRKQYRYHKKWSKIRNQTKFYKMLHFGNALPKIRAQVEKDLSQPDFSKTKVLAIVIKLLEETHIRIGNKHYANKNSTYGLSTLRSKHVYLFKNKIKFEFIGKRGKMHSVTLRNKRLIKLINQCEEIPGWELFKYYDDNGTKHNINSSMVNSYLQNISLDFFSAKDFRTWSASLICLETLLEYGITPNNNQIEKNIIIAIDAAASALGNTRNVARKYYIHPLIISSYKDGSIVDTFNLATAKNVTIPKFLTQTEYALLSLLSTYKLNNYMD